LLEGGLVGVTEKHFGVAGEKSQSRCKGADTLHEWVENPAEELAG
jgi:hypothetical protein